MFPQAGPTTCSPMGGWSSERRIVETQEELRANASAWNIASANVDIARGERYGYYRAALLTGSCQLDDKTPMSIPPPGAVYYASRLLVGHSYWTVVHGAASSFNGGVSAEFLNWNGSLDAFTQRHQLAAAGRGRGLHPNSGIALFASPEQVAQNYRTDRAPDGIIVVYRQIPGARTSAGSIAHPPTTIEIRFTSLRVVATGSAVKDYSNWTLTAQCNVNGVLYGQPTSILNSRVSVGEMPISFAQQIQAGSADNIECFVDGTYTRGSWMIFKDTFNIPRASTGLLRAGNVPSTSVISANNADARLAITFTATRVQ
jgi:hypothetical protein